MMEEHQDDATTERQRRANKKRRSHKQHRTAAEGEASASSAVANEESMIGPLGDGIEIGSCAGHDKMDKSSDEANEIKGHDTRKTRESVERRKYQNKSDDLVGHKHKRMREDGASSISKLSSRSTASCDESEHERISCRSPSLSASSTDMLPPVLTPQRKQRTPPVSSPATAITDSTLSTIDIQPKGNGSLSIGFVYGMDRNNANEPTMDVVGTAAESIATNSLSLRHHHNPRSLLLNSSPEVTPPSSSSAGSSIIHHKRESKKDKDKASLTETNSRSNDLQTLSLSAGRKAREKHGDSEAKVMKIETKLKRRKSFGNKSLNSVLQKEGKQPNSARKRVNNTAAVGRQSHNRSFDSASLLSNPADGIAIISNTVALKYTVDGKPLKRPRKKPNEYPVRYECTNCSFRAAVPEAVKKHIVAEHVDITEKYHCIDRRARELRKRQTVCHISLGVICVFHTIVFWYFCSYTVILLHVYIIVL